MTGLDGQIALQRQDSKARYVAKPEILHKTPDMATTKGFTTRAEGFFVVSAGSIVGDKARQGEQLARSGRDKEEMGRY